jgi:hypothetical protein
MEQDENQLYLEKRVNEANSMLTEVFESRVKEIIKERENLSKYKKDLFEQWIYIFEFYKKIIKKEGRDFSQNLLEYIFLGVLVEGLVKIILFFDDPNEYSTIQRGNRALGRKLTKRLTKLIKEPNETKFKELKQSLDLIILLRNNFIHFPFYSSDDYRFRWLFFQVFAYLLDKFSLWNCLDNSEGEFIKKMALEKPVGVSLLEVDLYEQ